MSSAEVIFQKLKFHKLLITVLFNARVRLFKAMDLHHVLFQIALQPKFLCATWLATLMWLCFVVHSFNVFTQGGLATEQLTALDTS